MMFSIVCQITFHQLQFLFERLLISHRLVPLRLYLVDSLFSLSLHSCDLVPDHLLNLGVPLSDSFKLLPVLFG